MKILVYGAGAIGGYIGGRLSQNGHDVTLVVREVTADAIRAYGLSIQEKGNQTRANPEVVTSIPQAFANDKNYDLIILGMKAYDLFPALDPLIAFCPHPKQLMTTQNGIGIENRLVEQFGEGKIIAGTVTLPISKETSSELVVEKDGGIGLAPTSSNQAVREWVKIFKDTGINTSYYGNFESMKWSKALLNIIGNATSAILNRPPKVIYRSEIMFDLEIRMVKEALEVMQVKRLKLVDLPGYSPKNLAFGIRRMPRTLLKPIMTNVVGNGRGDKMPSFHIDLSNRKGKSEILFHNVAIVKEGRKHNVETPVNAALSTVLVKIVRQEYDWREFDGRPKRLLAEVKKFETS